MLKLVHSARGRDANTSYPIYTPPPPSADPQTILGNSSSSNYLEDCPLFEIGLRFTVNVAGTITKIRIYRGSSNDNISYTGRIWNADTGTQLASYSFGTISVGWNEGTLETPLSVSTGVTYLVSSNADLGGGFTFIPSISAGLSSAITSTGGNLTALAGGARGNTTSGSFPNTQFTANGVPNILIYRDVVFVPS